MEEYTRNCLEENLGLRILSYLQNFEGYGVVGCIYKCIIFSNLFVFFKVALRAFM